MPEAWFAVDEACRYLGLDPWDPRSEDRLEELVVEYDVDVEVDEKGNLLELEPEDMKKVLIGEHVRTVGYRPDDPKRVASAQAAHERRKKQAKGRRREKREKLRRRVLRRVT